MLFNTEQSTGQPPTTENYPFRGINAAKVKKPSYKQWMQHPPSHACHRWDSVHTARDLQIPNPHSVTPAFLLRGKNQYPLNNIQIFKIIIKAVSPQPPANNLRAMRRKEIESKTHIFYWGYIHVIEYCEALKKNKFHGLQHAFYIPFYG